MLRYAIPVVVGIAGFGADRIYNASQEQDGRAPVVEERRDERREEPSYYRDACPPRTERCEPRRDRTYNVNVVIRREHDERRDRDDCRCEPRGGYGSHRR